MKTIKVTKEGLASPEIAKLAVQNANCSQIVKTKIGTMLQYHKIGNFEVIQVRR